MTKYKNKKMGFYLALSEEEIAIIRVMKEKYAINITQLLKNYIHQHYKELGTKKCITLST